MPEESNYPLPKIADRMRPGGDSGVAPDDGEPSGPVELLRGLDQILGRRAVTIERELAEISAVRKQIKQCLCVAQNGPSGCRCMRESGGASLGQMI